MDAKIETLSIADERAPVHGDAAYATITEWLDTLPLGLRHWAVFIPCAVGFMFEVIDYQFMAFAAPSLTREWDLGPTQLGMLFSVSAFGQLVGSLGFGMFADRFGRRASFQILIAFVGAFTALSYFVRSPVELAVLRFFVGCGVGGFVPVDSAILSEFMPARRRGLMLGLWALFLSFGNILAAKVAGWVIPEYGWRMLFLIGSAPVALVLAIRMLVPESPRFLLSQRRTNEAERSLLWISGNVELPLPVKRALASANPPADERVPVSILFTSQYRRRTVFIWALWFGCLFGYLGLFPWLPTFLSRYREVPQAEVFVFMTWFATFGLLGRVLVTFLIDTLGRRPLLIITGFGAATTAWMFAQQTGIDGLRAYGWSFGLFMEALTVTLTILTPELYPTRARTTGAGWALGAGRIGAITAPLAIGTLIAGGTSPVFIIIGASFAICAILPIIFPIETRQCSLESSALEVRP